MHEEHMNRQSFAKRASRSKDQLPNLHRPGHFCHDCQTNQMLAMNLMSAYLPPPESPDYQQAVDLLPKYKESINSRYPPVCDRCRPNVEEEIQRKEQMARRQALHGLLKGGKDRQRRVSGTPVRLKEKNVVNSVYWHIRGVLWFMSSIAAICSIGFELFGSSILARAPWYLQSSLPFVVVFSLLWTAWDPTYLATKTDQIQGREVRVHGRERYIACQMLAWASRLTFSTLHRHGIALPYGRLYLPFALIVEFIALFAYPLFLRVQHPLPIRLIDTHSHLNNSSLSRSATPAASTSRVSTPLAQSFPKITEQDLLASLSLSSKPVMSPNPVFGLPSLISNTTSLGASQKPRDEDAMDWSPINGNGVHGDVQVKVEDASWLRPQTFFPPEKPTGLENLFAQTRIADDSDNYMKVDQKPTDHGYQGDWWYFLLPIPPICLLFIYFFRTFWLEESPKYHTYSLGEL
ncbi:hypothetical protein FA15DRAFT_662859 [Coprinopsis marcescibilis]|uniref:Ima1 N-terminal domain-containing protein n=1 Tax=Coprinopsis marcescibilis TaxID=230819 RepID=A0A5C3LFY5_COPMA|nr:hypothetical protein FA15DRAFT_662859 [Coprinopsis marcescibilis]